MKSLTLLRHAKSSWDDSSLCDYDRPLNDRGRGAAARMGRELRDLGLSFDLILASPAKRVVETLDLVAGSHDELPAPRFDRRLYAASDRALLDIIRGTDDRVGRLLVVGHNPGLEDLAMAVTDGDQGPLRQSLAAKYPTATLAELSLAIDRWREAARGTASITRFIRPRDLAE